MNLGIVMARVVKVRPESHSVDVVVMADNRRIPGVQVLSGSAGSDFGFHDLSDPDNTGYEAKNSGTRDVYAAVAWMNGVPVVLGFLFPQVSQLNFAEDGRMVYRHGSDVYFTIDKDGNVELFHPSGFHFAIGQKDGHEDLSGRDYDKKWAIKRNTAPAKLHIGNGGETFSLSVSASGALSIKAAGVTIESDVTINGDLTVSKSVAAGEDVTANGISLASHTHGSSGSGAPVTGGSSGSGGSGGGGDVPPPPGGGIVVGGDEGDGDVSLGGDMPPGP